MVQIGPYAFGPCLQQFDLCTQQFGFRPHKVYLGPLTFGISTQELDRCPHEVALVSPEIWISPSRGTRKLLHIRPSSPTF